MSKYDGVIDEDFKKSSFSGVWAPIACVEVKRGEDGVEIRDSKNQDGPTLSFSHDEWRAFIAGANAGEFNS